MLRSSLRRHGWRTRRPESDVTVELLRSALGPALRTEALTALARFADVVDVGPGTALTRVGVIPRQLTVLLEGSAVVRPVDAAEWVAGPGERFGELEILSGAPLRSSVVTLGASTRVLVVFGPALGWAVAGLLAERASTPPPELGVDAVP